mgnify:CR=1 FL=1
MVRKISILIFVSLLSISNSTIALELLNDLDESSDCELCFTEINFNEGGCIISSGQVEINFVGDGAIDFGEDGYLDLGDSGSIAGYDEATSSMSAAGSVVLGENGRIVGGGIYAEEGFSIKLIDESSLGFYDGEDYLDECAKNYEEVFSSESVDSCEEQVNESGSKIALISDNEVYLDSGVKLAAGYLYIGSGDSSGIVLTSGHGNISIGDIGGDVEYIGGVSRTICAGDVDAGVEVIPINLDDNAGLISISENDASDEGNIKSQNNGGGAVSFYLMSLFLAFRGKKFILDV